MPKPALLSVTFGTSHEDTREQTIDAVEARLQDAFPDRAFYSAWTSERIVSKVKALRGEHHDTLSEALARLDADGAEDVVVATTCLLAGGEWNKVESALEAWLAGNPRKTARLAQPLLAGEADRHAIAECLCHEFSHVGDDEAALFMGHGSPVARNDVYTGIQDELAALGQKRFFVATVEGAPALEDVIDGIAACNPSCVHLAPLMMVAGDHAKNDLAGEGEHSWQSKLQARGLRTQAVMRGLGEYDDVQRLVCDHARKALPVK